MKFLVIIFILTSCASFRQEMALREQLNKSWQGRPVAAVFTHPYLQTLVLKKSNDELTFIRRGQHQSKARCQVLGGCMGLNDGDCSHVFRMQDNKVLSYVPRGQCFQETIDLKVMP